MDLECPYCEHQFNLTHDDGSYYDQDTTHQVACPCCEKNFVFITSVLFIYTPEKADCLNGGEHEYIPQVCFPISCTKMECSMCGDTRKPTEVEHKELTEQLSSDIEKVKDFIFKKHT